MTTTGTPPAEWTYGQGFTRSPLVYETGKHHAVYRMLSFCVECRCPITRQVVRIIEKSRRLPEPKPFTLCCRCVAELFPPVYLRSDAEAYGIRVLHRRGPQRG